MGRLNGGAMFCGQCGTDNGTTALFCSECGAPMTTPAMPAANLGQSLPLSSPTDRGASGPPSSLPPSADPAFTGPTPGWSETQVPPNSQPAHAEVPSPMPPVVAAVPVQYCGGCGNALHPSAVTCPRCGAPVVGWAGVKSKTAAVLLAVFLGPWTWVYTYKRDSWKFWVGMLIPFAWVILFILGLTVFASQIGSCSETINGQVISVPGCDTAAVSGGALLGFAYIAAWIIYPGIWIWSVIDTAVKNDTYYRMFPNG